MRARTGPETSAIARDSSSQEGPPQSRTEQRIVDQRYTLEQKRRIVMLLWKVAYADAVLAGHEEYLVRKVANLIHLPLADFATAKIRARDEFR